MLNMEAKRKFKMNRYKNLGFSLVEILVALAVSAILITGLSYILFTSLRLYGTNNANVEIQNESQQVLNLVADTILEARGVCMKIPDTDDDTECILLGDLIIQKDAVNLNKYEALFSGVAIVFMGAPVNEMYMVDLPDAVHGPIGAGGDYANYCRLAENEDTVAEAAQASLVKIRGYVYGMSDNARRPWLMGRFVESFVITPTNGLQDLKKETVYYVNGSFEDKYYFMEPITLHIDLGFEYQYNNRTITRSMEDDIAVRSRLKTIYVEENESNGSSGRGMVEYKRW